jgi:hypothetical protein
MTFIIAALLISSPVMASEPWWQGFCERHLIADDPYQFEGLSNDRLISLYFELKNSGSRPTVAINEMRHRLANPDLAPDDREILTKTLANEVIK